MDTAKQMSKMVDAVQPHCDEPITVAATCSHAGSMSSVFLSKATGGLSGIARTSELPNPVFLAVGADHVYAFAYKPRGFKFKIKKEVARWPRAGLRVEVDETDRMAYFTIATADGDHYAMELPKMMGAAPVVAMFLDELRTA